MRRGIAVHFACNDPDNGDFAGKVEMISIVIGRNSMDMERTHVGEVKFTELDDAIRIHRKVFKTIGVTHWCGNWCWNAYRIPYRDYRRLIRTLKANGWRCTSGLARWDAAYEALVAA